MKKNSTEKAPVKSKEKVTSKTGKKQETQDLTLLNGFSQKKKSFLLLFPELYGNITKTAESIGIDRGSFYHWIKTDAEFKQAIENLEPKRFMIDLAKSKLIEAIQQGNITAIIFTLKTLGKDEGFSERNEIINLNKSLDAEIENLTDEQIKAEIKRLRLYFDNKDKPLIITVENDEQKRLLEQI
jgi:hypothetical protein